MTDLIADVANRLFGDFADRAFAALPSGLEAGAIPWLDDIWRVVADMGFPCALLSEDEGGFGIDPVEALAIARIAATYALPVPLAETMLANWVLAKAGLPLAEGPAVLATGPAIRACGSGWRLDGVASRAPWGRHAAVVVVLDGAGHVARVTRGWSVAAGHNLAGEPRDDLAFDDMLPAEAVAEAPVSQDVLRGLGALARVQGMAGALEAVLARTVAYANEREQFGRPIGTFQAVQQNLAVLAGQTAAARAAADMAAAGLDLAQSDGRAFLRSVAAAKVRVGEAAGVAAAIAHQVHGAIGFTREYALHPFTTRLWSWRDEDGTEAEWAEWLGGEVFSQGADGFWPLLTGVPSHVVNAERA